MNSEEITTTSDILDDKQDEDKKFTWTKDKITLAIIFGALVIISVGLLIAILVKEDLLFLLVRNYFIRPILTINLGPALLIFVQVLIFLGLMVVQSLLVPIPSELILLSGGIIFGLVWGSVIGLAGSMLSAAVTYYISKKGGRAIVDASGEKVGLIKRTIYIFDEWIRSWGLWAILVGRAVPVIMFDPISYAAGLVKIKDWHYFLATFIGSIPRAIVYAFLGVQLIGGGDPNDILYLDAAQIEAKASQFNVYFFIIFGILIFMFVLSNVIYYVKKWKEKKDLEEQEPSQEESIVEEEESQPVIEESLVEETKEDEEEIEEEKYGDTFE